MDVLCVSWPFGVSYSFLPESRALGVAHALCELGSILSDPGQSILWQQESGNQGASSHLFGPTLNPIQEIQPSNIPVPL